MLGPAEQGFALLAGQLHAQLFRLMLQPAHLLPHLFHGLVYFLRTHPQLLRGPFQGIQALLDHLLGHPTGDGYDAPHARGAAPLAHDAQAANLCGGLHVGAAAEFLAVGRLFPVADGDHPHFIAVLFLEEGEGPLLDGPVEAGPMVLDRIVGQDSRVGVPLDGGQLLLSQGLGMGEVKAQTIGRNQGAILAHMLAQLGPQLRVEHVRGRVVAHDVPAAFRVDDGVGRIAHPNRARGHLAHVNDEPRNRPAGVLHPHAPDRRVHILREVVDLARVANLAAAFYIEGRLREHHLHCRPGVSLLDGMAIHQQGDDLGVRVLHIFVDKVTHSLFIHQAPLLQLVEDRGIDRNVPGCGGCGRAGPGPLPLRRHELVEALLVHSEALLLGYVPGDVQGKAVGVPQAEGVLTRDDGLAVLFQLGHQVVQNCQARVQGALEALLLRGDRA